MASAEKNFRNKEAKVKKKNLEADKKRQREMERQAAAFEQSLNEYGTAQTKMQMEIERLKAIPEKYLSYFLLPIRMILRNCHLMKRPDQYKKKSGFQNIVTLFVLKAGGLHAHQTHCRR